MAVIAREIRRDVCARVRERRSAGPEVAVERELLYGPDEAVDAAGATAEEAVEQDGPVEEVAPDEVTQDAVPQAAGEAAESELLRSGRALSADLLKVGHHGSRGSTTPAFLAAVSPRIALVSCGRENRFGHPAPETLASLAAARTRVFRTDIDSDLEVGLFPRATRLKMRDLP